MSLSSSSLCHRKLEHAVGVHLVIPTRSGLQHFHLNCIETLFCGMCFLQLPVNTFLRFEILLLQQRKVNVSRRREDLET